MQECREQDLIDAVCNCVANLSEQYETQLFVWRIEYNANDSWPADFGSLQRDTPLGLMIERLFRKRLRQLGHDLKFGWPDREVQLH